MPRERGDDDGSPVPPTIHATILVTGLAAAIAVALASVSIIANARDGVPTKADRLPGVAVAAGSLTVETRADGISVLSRVPLD